VDDPSNLNLSYQYPLKQQVPRKRVKSRRKLLNLNKRSSKRSKSTRNGRSKGSWRVRELEWIANSTQDDCITFSFYSPILDGSPYIMNTYQEENVRRKHNFIPFVFHLLKELAAKGKLDSIVDAAQKQAEERMDAASKKAKQSKA